MAWTRETLQGDLSDYADWELREAMADPRLAGAPLWLPVFVRLDAAALNGGLAAALQAAGGQVEVAGQDLATLLAEGQAALAAGAEARAVLWCRPGQSHNPAWQVLHVGAPMRARPGAAAAVPAPLPVSASSRVPLVAVIDDGIGFLNARFRRSLGHTRFRSVWLQGPLTAGPGGLQMGRVLGTAEIDGWLGAGRGEADVLREVNEALFGPDVHRSSDRQTAHGSSVLDLAAGADPADAGADPMLGVPLLAVQVLAEALGETSGRRLDPCVILGLRWVVDQALAARAADGLCPPLIINLSLGALSGPQDGSGFLEDWVAHELARFRRLSGNRPVRLVAAFGNARRARLLARQDLAPGETVALDWRLLPDDATASFVEIYWQGTGLALTLTGPDGSGGALALPNPGERQVLPGAGGAMMALYPMGPGAALLVAAPSARAVAGGAVAGSGGWRLTLGNGGKAGLPVSLRVQRDDTPDGYRRQGRQSWLDHPSGWQWDVVNADWSLPDPVFCPVRREGTAIGLAGLDEPGVYFAAAACSGWQGIVPAAYSAEGPGAGVAAPHLIVQVDPGAMLGGLRAAGVVSGARARLSGTSAAAPLVVRRLVQRALSPAGLTALPGQGPRDEAEVEYLLGIPAPQMPVHPLPQADARLGYGLLA